MAYWRVLLEIYRGQSHWPFAPMSPTASLALIGRGGPWPQRIGAVLSGLTSPRARGQPRRENLGGFASGQWRGWSGNRASGPSWGLEGFRLARAHPPPGHVIDRRVAPVLFGSAWHDAKDLMTMILYVIERVGQSPPSGISFFGGECLLGPYPGAINGHIYWQYIVT
jgi:hypothetical protein